MLSEKATEERVQYASTTGVFQYGSVFWGILNKPKDKEYNQTLLKSKVEYPQYRFAEKDMVELYPLQLQPGDNPVEWILYTNALRMVPIQYKEYITLPLPLHLAKGLEEYLFNA